MLSKICSIIFISYVVFLAPSAFPQKKTYPAFIVTTAHDTIEGNLLLQKDLQRLRSISFKSHSESTFSNYNATDLAAYGIRDSLLFITREIKSEKLLQRVFLRVVVNGPVSLYAADNLNSEGTFFLQKQQDPPQLISNSRYLGELNYLLSGCTGFNLNTEKGKKLKYSEEHLAATVQAYNTCQYPQLSSSILHTGRQFRTQFGLRAGSQFGRMGYMADKGMYQGRINEKVALAPVIVGCLFVNFSEAHRPLALQAELLLKRYNKAYTIEENNRVIPYTRVTQYSSTVLQFPFLLQYKLPLKLKAQPYVIAGPVGSCFFKSDFRYGISYGGSSVVGGRTEDVYQLGYGYMAGAGIQHKLTKQNRLLIDVRYNSEAVRTYAQQPVGSPEPRKFTFSGLQVTTGITL